MTPRHNALLASIEPSGVQSLVEGRHGDPFGVLGQHPTDGGSIIRVFMPGALSVEVLARESGQPLTVFSSSMLAGCSPDGSISR
jgi:1,4-alpha-glucan branching enzyme